MLINNRIICLKIIDTLWLNLYENLIYHLAIFIKFYIFYFNEFDIVNGYLNLNNSKLWLLYVA